MFIEPNGIVRIMRDVPLDNTYTDTLYFSTRTSQTDYFRNQTTGRNFSALSYQRVQRGYIRLQINAELIYDYNYLMFQNTAYGSRWFYAFINNVEYLNDNTTEIHFEIDVIQTWLFDVTLGVSYVEREHVFDDVIGAELQPEPIDIGPIVCDEVTAPDWFDDYFIVLATTETRENSGLVGGMYGAVTYHYEPLSGTGASNMQRVINTLVENNKMDSIVNVFIIPAEFVPSSGGGSGTDPWSSNPATKEISISRPTQVGNRTPRNKKLLTSPYTFLTVDCLNDSQNYKYEYSDNTNHSISFTAVGAISPDPAIGIYPTNYNGAWTGSPNTPNANATEALMMRGFPQCAIAIDAYRAWLAQGAVADGLNILQSAVGVGAGVAYGNPAMAAHNAVGIMQGINNAVVSATKGARVRGVQGTDADLVSGLKKIYFKKMNITGEYSSMIDDFFDRFGYACNRLKIPNRAARERWTYCKTRDCNLEASSAPVDALRKIKNIYDNGITWWKNPDEVGKYNLRNRPLGVQS